MSLFDEPAQPSADAEVIDSLDGRIDVFLNRWSWRGDRAVVEKELRALLDYYETTCMSETCRNAGCQEWR